MDAPGFRIDHVLRMKAGARETRREQIAFFGAPQNRTLLPRENSGHEESRLRRDPFPCASERFVERPGLKTARRQMPVDCLYAKRQHRTPSCVGAFKKADALAQLRQGWMRIQHLACLIVPLLFS